MTFFKERRQELALSMLTDIKIWGHFLLGLRGFLRHTISLEEARTIVRQRIAEREANFLRLVERGIFGYSRSPYLPLLKLAGCEMGDIRKMLQTRGLDETLRALREAGVYVTFDEFKGHELSCGREKSSPCRPEVSIIHIFTTTTELRVAGQLALRREFHLAWIT